MKTYNQLILLTARSLVRHNCHTAVAYVIRIWSLRFLASASLANVCFIQKSAAIEKDLHFARDDNRTTVKMMTMFSGKTHLQLTRDSNNSRGSICNTAHAPISIAGHTKFSFD
jgi:hypothetical protein